MKLRTTLLFSAVLLAAAPSSNAVDPPRNPFGNGELPEILKPFDVDGDGKLSEEERQAYLQAVHDGQIARPARPGQPPPGNPWDTDGDGKLSDEEKAAAQEAIRARILAQRSARFDELDKDDDGFLTADEFLPPGIRPEVAARILAHLDTDKDGKISKDEFLAALRPPRPPGGGGGGGGRPDNPPPPPGDPPPPPAR
ncbi:MAG TPA: EF-hand domain-containing protein [Verrucomicrobiales bacterium]|jgi:Ca2+-binding EF-hand superfamily protein|nr:EF-hand domain-containing protein [Verrucomicrobiales bacterium]